MLTPRKKVRMKLFLAETTEVITRNKLLAMQVDILPGDVPTSVDEGLWWFAFEGETLLAFCGMYVRHQDDPLVAFLCRAGVFPEFQGAGIQKTLIRTRVAKAKALGLREVVSDTFNNPASANNLIACGFKTYIPEVPWRADGTVYWRKELTCTKPESVVSPA